MNAYIKYDYEGGGYQSQEECGLHYNFYENTNQPCEFDYTPHDYYHYPRLEALMSQYIANQMEYERKNDATLERLERQLTQISKDLSEMRGELVVPFNDDEEMVIDCVVQGLEEDEFIPQYSCEKEGEPIASEDKTLSGLPSHALEDAFEGSSVCLQPPHLQPKTEICNFHDYIWDSFSQQKFEHPLLDEVNSKDTPSMEIPSVREVLPSLKKVLYQGVVVLEDELVEARKTKVRMKGDRFDLVKFSTSMAIESNATNPYDPG